MVATWLTELYLDQINRALLEERVSQGGPAESPRGPGAGPDPQGTEPRVPQLLEKLRSFVEAHCDALDPNVTVTLLASYGRLDILMHYAQLRQVWFSRTLFKTHRIF